MTKEKELGPIAEGIIAGLKQAIAHAKGEPTLRTRETPRKKWTPAAQDDNALLIPEELDNDLLEDWNPIVDPQTPARICPEDGSVMVRGVRPTTYRYKEQSVTVDQPGWHCPNCNEGFLEGEDGKVADYAIHLMKAQHLSQSNTSEFKFTHEWVKEEGDEVWTLIVPEIDVFGIGETKEDAIKSLTSTAAEYTDLFFKNLPMYMADNVRHLHYNYLHRIAHCEGDDIKIREVLGL